MSGGELAPNSPSRLAQIRNARTLESWKGSAPRRKHGGYKIKQPFFIMKDNTQKKLEQYIGHAVLDQNGAKVGSVECLWSDHTGQAAFLGIKTGWLLGKTHVVP